MPASGAPRRSLIGQLLRHARPSWRSIAGLFLVGLLASPLALLQPLPVKIAVDSVLGERPLPAFLDAALPSAVTASTPALLVLIAALAVGVALLGQLQALVQRYLATAGGEQLVLEFRSRLFRHLQRLSLSYHDTAGTADALYRIQSDAPAIRNIVIDGFIPFVSAAVTLAGMIYVMVRIDWQLALVAMAVSPPLALLSEWYRPRVRRQSRKVRRRESAALSVVHEALAALRVVKVFGREEQEGDRYARRSHDVMRRRLRLALLEGRYEALVGVITAAGSAAVLLIGIGHVRAGLLSLGDLLLVLGYLAKVYEPVKTMSRKMASLQGHLASAERALAVLERVPDVTERPDARPIAWARGVVAFRHVSFAYAPDRPVLHDVSFEIEPGTRLGIVGTTGAGKSTLVSLLTRLYDPSSGEVRLDGVDVRDYRLADLRRQIAVVPQDPVLFSVSIAANIAYAVPGATREQVVAAAQAADAQEFIEQLPRGYETLVGERGVMLSGGQRQRIALARAFLMNSPVLILDEPTSAVDAETEAAIRDATARLMRGRTVILISHRSGMLDGCTALLALEHGRVVRSDTAETRRVTRPSAVREARHDRPAGRLLSHPAVRAWTVLSPGHPVPRRLTPLTDGPAHGRKTMVYRLEGAGQRDSDVVAKRCRMADAQVERTVYEEVLGSLDLPSLRYYGCVADDDGEHGWLFVEEATGQEFSQLLEEHRAHAGRWLGRLHTGATRARAPAHLPATNPCRYLEHLRSARDRIRAHADNPVLSAADGRVLDGLLASLDDVEERWDVLEESRHAAPDTLVHGDFNGKNMRVRITKEGAGIQVFDWEDSGWGVPAVDLAQLVVPASYLSANPDLRSYWSVVRGRWPGLDFAAVHRLAHYGTIFRALAALNWDSSHLVHDWAPAFVRNMQLYAAEMSHAFDAVAPVRH